MIVTIIIKMQFIQRFEANTFKCRSHEYVLQNVTAKYDILRLQKEHTYLGHLLTKSKRTRINASVTFFTKKK